MEDNLYYKMLKLTSGDTIICKTDDSCINLYDRPFINIVEPIMLNLLRIPRDSSIVETYILIPWISFIESDILEIPTTQILVAANPKKELIRNYNEYIMYKSKDDSDTHTLDDDPDTEEILDQMLNELQRGDTDEDDEEEGREGNIIGGGTRSTRILH